MRKRFIKLIISCNIAFILVLVALNTLTVHSSPSSIEPLEPGVSAQNPATVVNPEAHPIQQPQLITPSQQPKRPFYRGRERAGFPLSTGRIDAPPLPAWVNAMRQDEALRNADAEFEIIQEIETSSGRDGFLVFNGDIITYTITISNRGKVA